MYKLFLDDERDPIDDSWIVVRSYDEAVKTVETLGFPGFVSFDHDLGSEKTGYDFAKYLVNYDIKSDTWFIPNIFNYYVHSQNPIGKENIVRFLESYKKMKFEK